MRVIEIQPRDYGYRREIRECLPRQDVAEATLTEERIGYLQRLGLLQHEPDFVKVGGELIESLMLRRQVSRRDRVQLPERCLCLSKDMGGVDAPLGEHIVLRELLKKYERLCGRLGSQPMMIEKCAYRESRGLLESRAHRGKS